ncbi:MAG TPA: hypothetical protein VLE27_09185, partial [Thermoanaerobaculia bacterium]|nr:hypothetical protein [Thermoanaerobaculia bacterium]
LPALSLLGQGVTLRPQSATPGRTVPLEQDDPLPEPEKLSKWIVLAWGATNLCEISNKEGQLFIESYGRSDDVRFQVHVDGELLRPSVERALKGKEVIRITGGTSSGSRHRRFSYSLMYLGRQRPVLAFSSWRNGRVRRVVSEGSLARLAEDLGRALDARGNEPELPLPSGLTLTIDDSLHQQLERSLGEWMKRIYQVEDPPRRRRGMSLAVLDAFSGEVLALPSLPTWKIRRESSRPGSEEPPERQWVRNDNLRNHAIGSTIKPVLFAAVASGYWPAQIDLGRLAVQHTSDCASSSPDGIHSHCSIAGVRLDESWDCLQGESSLGLIDARSFLVDSRNFYAGVLGLLGTATSPADWKEIVRQQEAVEGETTVSYGGVVHAASLAWAPPDRNPFTIDDRNPPRPKVTELGRSILFRQMSTVFGLEPNLEDGDGDPYSDYLLRTTGSFYPVLAKTKVHRSQGIEEALPDLQSLRPGSFHSTRKNLLSFFLGGGTAGRWNNVRLAEAAARIATGASVKAHLEGPGPRRGFSSLAAPLSIQEWRNAHLIEPLRSVGLTGTAESLRPFILSAEQDGYRILVKTGTLEELPPPVGSSLRRYENELLLFVIGKWQNGEFVPGLTLSGVLHLQDSKPLDRREWVRTEVAQPILTHLLDYLKLREARRMNS